MDKHVPRRSKITIDDDLGDRLVRDILTTPKFNRERKAIPKKPTGEWQTIYRGNGIKILKSLRSDRVYMFLEDGEYIGELEDIDQTKLGVRLLENAEVFNYVVSKRTPQKTYEKAVLSWTKIRPNFVRKYG